MNFKLKVIRLLLSYYVILGVYFIAEITGGNVGLLSPIEVIEEWGCHDTDFHLKCSRLDSTMAILEASFTPNCTNTDNQNCGLWNRFSKAGTNTIANQRLSETEAGQRFLETLRKTRDDVPLMLKNDTASSELFSHSDKFVGSKSKRNLLKASLERLIEEYLERLSSPDSDNQRQRRFLKNYNPSDNYDDNQRIAIRSSGITEPAEDILLTEDKMDWYARVTKERSECRAIRTRFVQLDSFELDRALENLAENTHNIRRVLNYRCSGKHNCNFLFALDHPFSMLWNSGTVRIKYVCMDDFRLNKYCGEHLSIGNEKTKSASHLHQDEPVAEARIQKPDQSFHQVNLKIMKAKPEEKKSTETSGITNTRKNKTSGIFSQDFRIMKVISNNVQDINSIEQIGDEYYFKKDKEKDVVEVIDPETTPEIQKSMHFTLLLNNSIMRPLKEKLNENDEFRDEIHENSRETKSYVNENSPNVIEKSMVEESIFSTAGYEIWIREGEEIVHRYLKSTRSVSTTASTHLQNNFKNKSNNSNGVFYQSSTSSIKTVPNFFLDFTTTPNNVDKIVNDSSVINKNKVDNEKEAEDSSSNYTSSEDIAAEHNARMIMRLNKNRLHTSHQMAIMQRPLLQGFIATPGYPKFYIGQSECVWHIIAPKAQQIRLTLLDINLRYDTSCVDFLTIVDLQMGRGLFNSCTESSVPLNIVSDSNELKVAVKTTSKMAYPKRGVLLHYMALGCLTPSSPLNGRLVNRIQNRAEFICDPSFVFPDTATQTRELICTELHTWDKILPNCVEEEAKATNGVVLHFNRSKDPLNMSDKNSDMVYDVLIPSMLIAGLFAVNAAIFIVILRYRQQRKARMDEYNSEWTDL